MLSACSSSSDSAGDAAEFEAAAAKWINEEFQPSAISKDEQTEEILALPVAVHAAHDLDLVKLAAELLLAVREQQGRVEWAIAWPLWSDGSYSYYCNTIPTPDGGTHEQGLRAALTKGIRAFADLVRLRPPRLMQTFCALIITIPPWPGGPDGRGAASGRRVLRGSP